MQNNLNSVNILNLNKRNKIKNKILDLQNDIDMNNKALLDIQNNMIFIQIMILSDYKTKLIIDRMNMTNYHWKSVKLIMIINVLLIIIKLYL